MNQIYIGQSSWYAKLEPIGRSACSCWTFWYESLAKFSERTYWYSSWCYVSLISTKYFVLTKSEFVKVYKANITNRTFFGCVKELNNCAVWGNITSSFKNAIKLWYESEIFYLFVQNRYDLNTLKKLFTIKWGRWRPPPLPTISKPLYGVWNTYQHSRGYYLDPPVWPLVMFFAILHLCEPPKNPTRIEGQHTRRNFPHNLCYTGKYKDKHQITDYSVYGKWKASPTRFDFFKVKIKSFRMYSYTLTNKYKCMIHSMGFIAFKKEVTWSTTMGEYMLNFYKLYYLLYS